MFPFTLYGDEVMRGCSTFRATWHKIRPPNLIWFAYDVRVNSLTNVTFIVYDMKDNFYGGFGEEIHRVTVDVPEELTRKHVEQEARYHAERQRAEELKRAEEEIIDRYTQEILKRVYHHD